MSVHRLLCNGKSEQVPDEFIKCLKCFIRFQLVQVGAIFGVDDHNHDNIYLFSFPMFMRHVEVSALF